MMRSSSPLERDSIIQDPGLVLRLLLHLLFWTGRENLLRTKGRMQARFIPVCMVESKMLKYAGAAVIALAALAAPEARAATLDGMTLSAVYLYPDAGTVYSDAIETGPFTVGAGVDASIDVEGVTDILLDFAANALTVTFNTKLTNPTWVNSSFNGLQLSLLSGTAFTGFSHTGGSIAPFGTSFDASNLFITWPGVSYVDGSTMNFDVAVAPVPLPATLPFLAAGMAGFALLRRRRTA
jgi:hypothetical protein